ncbi:MAG: amidohydrolase family protein [Armatimonadetes bacterium]|nr:amidohydrolase family protein [Armatimonadota bacterium]
MASIIDFHHHIKGGDLYRREATAEQVVAMADRAGIEKTVVFSMSLPSRESNELTQREAAKFPERLLPFAHVLPQEGALALREVDRCFEELGWRGLKLHRGEAMDLSPSAFVPLLKKCAEAQRPCLIDVASQLDFARELAEAVPDCPLVIAHLGAPHNEALVDQFLNLALEYPHLRFDLSYCHVPWKMQGAVDTLGAERLLFGSDGPLIHPLIELAKIEVLDLDEEQRRLILHDNAAALLGLE